MNTKLGGSTIETIALELNKRSRDHPIGELQDIRKKLKSLKRRPARDIFAKKSIFSKKGYAYHIGGQPELQFNIGVEKGTSELRHGVAFSFEPSRSVHDLKSFERRVELFNDYITLSPDIFSDMVMWVSKGNENSPPLTPDVISQYLFVSGLFVFFGKRQPLADLDYELILDDFDHLLPLYKYVESGGATQPISTLVRAPFQFRPGHSERPSSTIATQGARELNVTLQHNDLQKALFQRLEGTHGNENVGEEQHTGVGTFVDVVVRHSQDGYWFYEIKTALSARLCIRDAIGQLLEYSTWPGSPRVERMVVVGKGVLDQDGAEYLRRLKDRFNLPIAYEQVSI